MDILAAPTSSERQRFSLRRATRADASGLMRLIIALAQFEKLPPPDASAQTRLLEDGFGAKPRFETWLAFWEGQPEPISYAIVLETYSSFLARPTLYLEDLFVLPEFRRHGVGTALLRQCIRLADERGCGRMEWTALDWNTNAQAFYERLGARRLSEWYWYRLDRATIEKIASSPAPLSRPTPVQPPMGTDELS